MGGLDFDDLQGERKYRRWFAYGHSKLANLLFAFELQRRATAAGSNLLSLAAHPGYAATELHSKGAQIGGATPAGEDHGPRRQARRAVQR